MRTQSFDTLSDSKKATSLYSVLTYAMFADENTLCEGILTPMLPLVSTCGDGVLGRGLFVGARDEIFNTYVIIKLKRFLLGRVTKNLIAKTKYELFSP